MAAWDWPDSALVRVIDADTLDAVLTRDLGFGGRASFPVRLRLNRINAPALKSTRGKQARDRLVELLSGEPFHVTTIQPYKYGGPKTMAGEWMAELVLADGRNVSDVLVSEGLAVSWDGQGARPEDG